MNLCPFPVYLANCFPIKLWISLIRAFQIVVLAAPWGRPIHHTSTSNTSWAQSKTHFGWVFLTCPSFCKPDIHKTHEPFLEQKTALHYRHTSTFLPWYWISTNGTMVRTHTACYGPHSGALGKGGISVLLEQEIFGYGLGRKFAMMAGSGSWYRLVGCAVGQARSRKSRLVCGFLWFGCLRATVDVKERID